MSFLPQWPPPGFSEDFVIPPPKDASFPRFLEHAGLEATYSFFFRALDRVTEYFGRLVRGIVLILREQSADFFAIMKRINICTRQVAAGAKQINK